MSSNHRSKKRYFERKVYDELGLESLQLHCWFRKLCYFYKFCKNEPPLYLFKLLLLKHPSYTTRNAENIPLFKIKHTFFKNVFFLSAVTEWNSLDHNIRKVGNFSVFKNSILKFIRPTPNSVFICENRYKTAR